MADFTASTGLVLRINTGTVASGTSATQVGVVWTPVPLFGAGTGQELRWSDSPSQGATASASWPFMVRPVSAQTVPYLYVFSADTTSLGAIGTSSSTPTVFANANLNMASWSWDAVGTFASAPTFTAYASNLHNPITRNSPSGDILAGSTSETGATARSYLKANLYGSGATTQVPGVAPTNAPAVADGAASPATPGVGAWLTNYQSMQGDNDFITYGSTPTATTAQIVYAIYALFTGPFMLPGTYVPVLSTKYTWT